MGPVGLWASGWLCSKSVIAALAAATPPVSIVSLPTLLVSVTVSVFMRPTPKLEDQGDHSLSGLYPSTF